MKIAVLSMDIEDWYHLDYFRGMNCDKEHSLLDGVSVYREVLSEHGIQSSFFVLGELVQRNRGLLSELVAEGHDIGAHGWSHLRPLTMSLVEFREDLKRSKQALEDATGTSAEGYRAPCFSLDRARLDLVREAGFLYDSSYLPFQAHPLYGKVDLSGFTEQLKGIYRFDNFLEFDISSLRIVGKNIPVSGGGYLRIFPWLLMRSLVKAYLKKHSIYTLYIHPFELSTRPAVSLPEKVGRATRLRFNLGRSSTRSKLSKLILLLKSKGFQFTTFRELSKELLSKDISSV